jgi:phosphoesterase RecJ-like protein
MQEQIKQFVEAAQKVVIVQADNPDADSLASSLALEQILGDMGKEPVMYCGVDMPQYLRYLAGWDRVVHELPAQFDASIIVDTSALSLLETLQKTNQLSWLRSKPCLVLDHHETESSIDFATISYAPEEAVATGEVIYELAITLDWPLSQPASGFLATSILSDSLGLISEGTTARSVHIIGELVERGVSLALLDNARRTLQKKSPEILAYKGKLLERITYSDDQRIASVVIPWDEIEKYSHQYNPSILVLDEMRQVEKVCLGIAYKTYPDGRITGKIRTNYGFPVAAKLAEHFGGGGHVYASGFRVTDGRALDEVMSQCTRLATELLDTLKKDSHEITQHADAQG